MQSCWRSVIRARDSPGKGRVAARTAWVPPRCLGVIYLIDMHFLDATGSKSTQPLALQCVGLRGLVLLGGRQHAIDDPGCNYGGAPLRHAKDVHDVQHHNGELAHPNRSGRLDRSPSRRPARGTVLSHGALHTLTERGRRERVPCGYFYAMWAMARAGLQARRTYAAALGSQRVPAARPRLDPHAGARSRAPEP